MSVLVFLLVFQSTASVLHEMSEGVVACVLEDLAFRIGNIEKHFSLICCQVFSSKSKAAYFEVSFSVHLQILLNTVLVCFFLKSWYILVVLPELHNLK